MPASIKTEVRTDGAPVPKPFLSQGVVVGNMVYVSGSLGVDPKTGKLVEGTIGDRTDRALKNISNILEAAGTSLSNLVKVNIFITDMSDFNIMNEAYMEVVKEGVMPVRTCVAVKQLPFNTDVEIEATAHMPAAHL
ncbi:Endoribonuclease L-PSP/chorismate mutase-like protein [Dactylonectria estremocensis]|uniref:Endoribonuclease L-PSP/chorismate mutase-like protein n=1 Tax=Dactylonectria estremocensis TaxID=1079267 RepID=A0A9P9DQY6_9HYPO|nr:Endoribonuclease L-PSP/chorismate mutase-like protein [Dactylonectria estremocensis]